MLLIDRRPNLSRACNSVPKYVVASTLEHPDWNNSMVLKGDAGSEVSKLKQELHEETQIAASFQLVHALMEHDLVDELRLKIFPVVLGSGELARADEDVCFMPSLRCAFPQPGGRQDLRAAPRQTW